MSKKNEVIPKEWLNISQIIREQILNDLFSLGSLSIPDMEFINSFLDYPHGEGGDSISIYFRLSICLINFFSAEDPLQLHYTVSREVLETSGGRELEAAEKARD